MGIEHTENTEENADSVCVLSVGAAANKMKNIDSRSHVRGESVYLDDIPVVRGTLYACVFDSPVAYGKLKRIDTGEAEKSAGVVRIITAKDLIGENQIGVAAPDEPLLADGDVHFQGMPIAIVVAATEELARKAARKIIAGIEPLKPVTDPRDAAAREKIGRAHV